MMTTRTWLIAGLLLAACDGGSTPADAGGPAVDSGGSGEVDAGGGEVDAGGGEVDAGGGEVDAGGGGTMVTPEIVATIDGTESRFTLSYVSIPAGGMVAAWVAMNGMPVGFQLTLRFPAMVGTFTDEMTYAPVAPLPGGTPAYSTNHASITVTEYGPPGGAIRGTFSGSVSPIGRTETIEITNGRFTVPHPVGM